MRKRRSLLPGKGGIGKKGELENNLEESESLCQVDKEEKVVHQKENVKKRRICMAWQGCDMPDRGRGGRRGKQAQMTKILLHHAKSCEIYSLFRGESLRMLLVATDRRSCLWRFNQ